MYKSMLIASALLACAAVSFAGNPQSPSAQAAVTIAGKAITIKYSAPSLRGRQMFAADGPVSKDPTYPVWRTGADDATVLHTDADLMIGSLNVPKGDYTIYTVVNVSPWKLVVNKQTGQWGTEYDATKDLGRVDMTVTKPAAPIETFKITISTAGGNKGKLQLEWANVVASVPFTVK
jgi:hypothetical protein